MRQLWVAMARHPWKLCWGLLDTHEHPSDPDTGLGVVPVFWHSSECQRLHLLLPNSFMCLTSERDLSLWGLAPWTPDFLQNPRNSTVVFLKIAD